MGCIYFETPYIITTTINKLSQNSQNSRRYLSSSHRHEMEGTQGHLFFLNGVKPI